MPTPTFQRLTLAQFTQLLQQFPFTRQINAVHMHHTRLPDRARFSGHDTLVSMWRLHTQAHGWSDIAQHVTIDPEGCIWLGRDWNRAPVSAAGHNGNDAFGPFMLALVGDFDVGRDPFDGEQQETTLRVVALVQSRFALPTSTLVFHNAMGLKSCPGSALDRAAVLAEVERRGQQPAATAPGGKAGARAASARGPFPEETSFIVADAIAALRRAPLAIDEPANAELSHDEHEARDESIPSGVGPRPDASRAGTERPTARDSGLSPAALAALRPHLVNLSAGHFSSAGEFTSTPADVDAMFEQHLPAALAAAAAAKRPLRILFWAHGGLVSEDKGLQGAARHIDWWKANDVYPVFFIWETGLFETLGRILREAGQAAGVQPLQRGLGRGFGSWFSNRVGDPLIESLARVGGGRMIWNGMKSAAERAVDAPTTTSASAGGARYVAEKLKAFCGANGKAAIELHAAGHSAGSIFHAHFMSAAQQLGVPTFASAQFLAPAIRVDTFKALLGARIGDKGIARALTMFTLKKDIEKADDCALVYRKSLLYLVSNAFENHRGDAILGLEESIRADTDMKRLFGLDGDRSARGEVIWSPTQANAGRSASTATTHGGFDDDGPTMNSVLRRVLSKADADSVVEFPVPRDPQTTARAWFDRIGPDDAGLGWPATAPPASAPPYAPPAPGGSYPPPVAAVPYTAPAIGWSYPLPPSPAEPAPAWSAPGDTGGSTAGSTGTGRRRALCIGIDQYPDPQHRLAGCVADARLWADTLTQLGFSTAMLLDGDATRAAIDRELQALIAASRPGDVVVFQYAGHGTQVPDLNGDEADQRDEALCPIDFATGALYIDDDIAEVFARLPNGVNLTCFTDCCHSGTNSRFAVGRSGQNPPRPGHDERKRYVMPTPELEAAHLRFRERLGASTRAVAGSGGRAQMRNVKFAACRDDEVAWESNGHGEFTLRATRILADGINGLSNEQLRDRTMTAFGPQARQHPLLDCSTEARGRPLLRPLGPPHDGVGVAAASATAPGLGAVDPALLAQTLGSIQQLLDQLARR